MNAALRILRSLTGHAADAVGALVLVFLVAVLFGFIGGY